MLLLCFNGLIACKKKNNAQPVVVVAQPSPTYMKAIINGTDYYSDSIRAYSIPYYHDSGAYNLLISADKYTNGTNQELILYISYYTGKGTYLIDPPNVYATYYKNNTRYYATSGNIIVTADSAGYSKGTFNFSSGSATITNGVFCVGK